jgi:hypothetical protein
MHISMAFLNEGDEYWFPTGLPILGYKFSSAAVPVYYDLTESSSWTWLEALKN